MADTTFTPAGIPDAAAPYDGLPAGTQLRNYEVLSVLGHGGFGITYRARDATLNRDVALKEYLPDGLAMRIAGLTVVPRGTSASADFIWGRDRFLEEARILARLGRVPAVVPVYDFLEANSTAYMVMALIEGETLEQWLERSGQLPLSAIEALLPPLLQGLEEVHAAGFLHRDIKPANIIIDPKGNPTLIDFGAARAAVADRSKEMTSVYTPGYAPLEQYTPINQGPWTDIYALSATLYHAITGHKPPGATERAGVDTYKPIGCGGVGTLPGLAAGIDAGLAVQFRERPQSIADWRRILFSDVSLAAPQAAAAPVVPSTAMPDNASATAEPATAAGMPAGRKRLLAAGAIAVALLLGIAGAYAVLGPTLTPAKQQAEAVPTLVSTPATAATPPTDVTPVPAPPPTPTATPAPLPEIQAGPPTEVPPPRSSGAAAMEPKRFESDPPRVATTSAQAGMDALGRQEYAAAYRLLLPQAQLGNAIAQKAVGDLLMEGRGGVPKDTVEGLKWLKRAVLNGAPRAELSLAVIYQLGATGLPRNAMRAYAWYSLAAREPSVASLATSQMNDLAKQMSPGQLAEARKQAAMLPKALVAMPDGGRSP